MKKIICVLTMLAVMCTATGCVSAGEYDELTQKYESLTEKYNTLVTNHDTLQGKYDRLTVKYEELDELYDSYVALTESQLAKVDVVFETFGKQISEEAVTSAMGDVVVIKLPYTSPIGVTNVLTEDVVTTLATLMASSDYKSCIFFFVDNIGVCQIGFNFPLESDPSYFVMETE